MENVCTISLVYYDISTKKVRREVVIKNKVAKMKTDPFSIYVLLFDQGVRPLYTLKV
jgi:hypothetical protein